MARARRVKGIRRSESLRENAGRVVEVRLDELLSWRSALEDPSLARELHDMRIAAKRLRYALEVFEVCFPEIKPLLRRITSIQEDLGAIHDLDVLVDLLRARLCAVDGGLEAEAVTIVRSCSDPRQRSSRLRQLLYSQAREQHRLGLIGLMADKTVERERAYASVVEQWGGGALEELAAHLRQAVGLTPALETDRAVSQEGVALAP